jgi:acid phosphatase (class A)
MPRDREPLAADAQRNSRGTGRVPAARQIIWFHAAAESDNLPAMKRYFLGPWLAIALFVAPLAAGHFLRPDATDWAAVLPPPPAAGSLAAQGDLETVLQMQADRNATDVAWAKLVEPDDIYADFRDLLGPWFKPESLPVTAEFIKQVTEDVQEVRLKVKGLYARPRPPAVDRAVRPCVGIPTSNSYPSGHALRAYVWAAVLGDVFADRRDELEARARRVAWGRIIGGVHFPTDSIGGRIVARAIVAELRKDPAYQAAVGKCLAETAVFRLRKAA